MEITTQEKLGDIIFYIVERSIKTYRQFAQRNIAREGVDITIDQWLVLKSLEEKPQITQQELAVSAFKDFASITRIIELLVTKGYLTREFHPSDRRRFNLTITSSGVSVLDEMQPIIARNRKSALDGISGEEMQTLTSILGKITANCQTQNYNP